MPSIYLGLQSSTFSFASVTVKEEPYPTSNLFKKFKHTPPSSDRSREIYLFKTGWAVSYYFARCATLQPGSEYRDSKLEYAEVYFNKFDKNYTALVCLLKFDTGTSRIYTHSGHGSYIDGHKNTNITTLTEFTSGKNILDEVLKENDKLTELLTYDIGKKQGDTPNGDGTYNGKKIGVQEEPGGEPKLSEGGFKWYKHTPEHLHGSKKACVIYNYNLLIGENKNPITSIHDKPYDHINVYYSDKVFEPLLLELKENGSSNTSKYYYHTWEGNDGDDRSLYWKKIQQGKKVLDVTFDSGSTDVHTQLTESGGNKLLEVLKALELHLQKTIVFMIDKKDKYEQNTFKSSFDKSSKYRLINQQITPEDKTSSTEGQCLKNTGFVVYEHDFTTSVKDVQDGKEKVELKFLVPNSESAENYDEIKIHSSEATEGTGESIYYTHNNNKIYVYYYSEDPRPLLVCYNGCAYKPRNLNKDDKEKPVEVKYAEWEKVATISTCTCQNGDTTGTNQHILEALTQITGFLNPVQINPTQIPNGACKTITADSGDSTRTINANYPLHTYIKGKTTIKMGITRQDVGCYDKYTYQPYGTNGTGTSGPAEGYRLGNVFHAKTSKSTTRSPLNYTSDSPSNKYYPLVGVTVYYYDRDSKYNDPLLIELEFKTNGVGGATEKEYYKLKPGDGSGGTTLKWEKDTAASSAIGPGADNDKIIAHLDSIRHSLKKVVKILLDKQQTYPLCWSKNAGGANGGYSPGPGGGTKQIQVQACTEGECSKLKSAGYVCYVHKVSQITGGGGSEFDYNQIGGLKFYISGNGSEGTSGDIEIKLHKNGGGQVEPITYNTCMGDLYVFFYCKNGDDQSCTTVGTSNKPTAPLMLYYNQKYYKPKDINDYFEKWVPDSALKALASEKPCGGVNGGSTQLANKLNEVNKSLNRICLTKTDGLSGVGSNGQYGIRAPSKPASTVPSIELNRVKVTKQGPKPERPYCKLVHRTMNDFTIGDIWYGEQDITKGVQINNGGGGTITVDSPGHTKFVNPPGNNNPNTVVAYYHKDDSTYKLPQLIVLLHTEKAIEQGSEPITASRDTKYGYYVLATNGTGGDYQYEWRSDSTGSQFKLDDQTEFSLLNSIVILVEKQKQYDERVINSALTNSKAIRSPGNSGDVNRLKNRNITLNGNTDASSECVKKYGYVLKSHDLSTVTAEIFHIKPILGLRFLIPSESTKDGYHEIILHTGEKADQLVGPLYHTSANNTVYVFFYDKDPRPLLMCFGIGAYIPKKQNEPTVDKQVDVDYKKWVKETKIKSCVCSGENSESPNKEILETLLKVVLFLNPVQINPTQIPTTASLKITAEPPKPPSPTPKEATYELHKFTATQTVQMKITRESVECYEKYTYEPNGTNSDGTGFRLGNVIYHETGDKPKGTLEYNAFCSKYQYYSLLKANVYYYRHDKQYQDPLLIELEFNTNGGLVGSSANPKEYYKLKALIKTDGTGMDWEPDQGANDNLSDDSDNQKLVNYLDKIRYQFKKVLQVCIAFKQNKTYQANLLDRNSDQPVSSEQQINVPVSEEKTCPSLTGTGFRCFKHGIQTLASDALHKFAAVQFFIPGQEASEVKLNLHESSKSNLIEPLYYNCGMGDIYVYFYGKGNGQGQGNGDPRPLLLCYNSKGYRATTMVDYDKHKWYQSPTIFNCVCEKSDTKLLEELVNVSNFLNPVKLLERPKCMNKRDYTIHKFNGKEITIQVSVTKAKPTFCYYKYTHEHNGTGNSPKSGKGFKLGNIEYNNQCIQDQSKLCTCITSVLDESQNKYTTASEVVVYYYKGDPNYKNPLLVVLCKKTNGGVPNGPGNPCTYNPYYELQRSTTTTTKMYSKQSKPLNLDDSKGGELEKLLDKILYYISKSLQINLSFRPRTTVVKYRGKSGIQKITIIKNKYSANVYDNIENKPKPLKTTTSIDVSVTGPTYLLTDKKEETGYQCYRHLLTQIKDINNFGGLRLFLWDNRSSEDESDCKITKPTLDTKPKCCEIDLHGDGSGSTSTKIDPIAYTTCKGDLYVYFYGSDPRPMLLCYNGQSYAPQSMDEYNQKWCRVSTITSCECDKTGFKPEQLLQQLYKTSMFLNPVRLWETMAAYEKVKPVIDEFKKAKNEGKEVPKLGKLPDHVYTVQTFGDYEIRVRVKTSDLQCYRKYTFESAMGDSGSSVRRDYRLGDIYYGEGNTRGADSTCLKYPQERRLQSVSLYYYMYDLQHRYPLIIQLDYGFGGELDDYFRVCKIGAGPGVGGQGSGGPQGSNGGGGNGGGSSGNNGAQGGTTSQSTEAMTKAIASKITWVKMKEKVEGSTQAQGQAQTGSASTSTCKDECKSPTDYTGKKLEDETVKELKENDSRFVKEAHMVQGKIRDLSQGDPTYGKWYMDVSSLFNHYYMDYVAELQALIEARCFDVRKKYEIKYEKGEENKNLIMVTDENCYEYHGSLKCFKNRVNVLDKLVYIANMVYVMVECVLYMLWVIRTNKNVLNRVMCVLG